MLKNTHAVGAHGDTRPNRSVTAIVGIDSITLARGAGEAGGGFRRGRPRSRGPSPEFHGVGVENVREAGQRIGHGAAEAVEAESLPDFAGGKADALIETAAQATHGVTRVTFSPPPIHQSSRWRRAWWRGGDCQHGVGAVSRAKSVGDQDRIAAGAGKLDVGERETGRGGGGKVGAVQPPLEAQRWRPAGLDGKARARTDNRRLIGGLSNNRRRNRDDCQQGIRANYGAVRIGHLHGIGSRLAHLNIGERQRASGGRGEVGPVEDPLVTQGRGAGGADTEGDIGPDIGGLTGRLSGN